MISVILAILYSSQFFIAHQIINNKTTFTCEKKELNVSVYVFIILFYSSQAFIFVILNTVTTVQLWKSIKNRSNLSGNATNINKSNLSVRFSISNILSTFFIIMIYFNNFITDLLVILGLARDIYFYFMYYIKYIFVCLTVINPVIYLILFRNFRLFAVCKSL